MNYLQPQWECWAAWPLNWMVGVTLTGSRSVLKAEIRGRFKEPIFCKHTSCTSVDAEPPRRHFGEFMIVTSWINDQRRQRSLMFLRPPAFSRKREERIHCWSSGHVFCSGSSQTQTDGGTFIQRYNWAQRHSVSQNSFHQRFKKAAEASHLLLFLLCCND